MSYNTRSHDPADKQPAMTKQGESKSISQPKTAAGGLKEPVASSKSKDGVEDVPSGESESDSSEEDDDDDEEEAVVGEVAVPLNEGESDDHPKLPATEEDQDCETSISGINKIRLDSSLPPEQSNQDLIDHSNLNNVQKDKIHKRRKRRSRSPVSHGEGPSQPKNKGPDPHNWAGTQDISEEEPKAQQAILDDAALNKQACFAKDGIKDDDVYGNEKSKHEVKTHKGSDRK
jgi:hypothetical protein